MKALKIVGIVFLVLFIVFTTLFTIYFLFANDGYGIEMLTQTFENGFFGGIKTFFVDIWKGIKYVFKA